MRVDLIAQRTQFGGLGGAAIFRLAPFGGAHHFGIAQGKIQRGPGDQQEIAAERDIGQLPPQAFVFHRVLDQGDRRLVVCIRSVGGIGIVDIDQHVARHVVMDMHAGFGAVMFGQARDELRLDGGERLLVDHCQRQCSRQHDNQRRHEPNCGRAAFEPAQQRPGEHRHNNSRQRDQCAPPHQIAEFAQIDHQRAHRDQYEIARPHRDSRPQHLPRRDVGDRIGCRDEFVGFCHGAGFRLKVARRASATVGGGRALVECSLRAAKKEVAAGGSSGASGRRVISGVAHPHAGPPPLWGGLLRKDVRRSGADVLRRFSCARPAGRAGAHSGLRCRRRPLPACLRR